MVREVITIGPGATVREAVDLMHRHSIRHLPVVDGAELLGLVTESNLRPYLFAAGRKEPRVSEVMIMNPITVDPNASVDSAARLIHQYKIGGLPVLEKRRLVGILTITDILAAFIELFGILQESSRVDLVLADREGALDEALKIIREAGGRVISIGMEVQSSRRKVHYIRVEKTDLAPIVEQLESHGHRVVSVLD
nr:CBS domain-containing protein [Dissulfurirhabdus thermomarina]